MPSQSQAHVGASGGLRSQDGVSPQEEDTPLYIPQLNHLSKPSLVRGEDTSNVVVTVIPVQNMVTLQILRICQPFEDLKLTFVVSLRVEQIRFRVDQRIVSTAEDSVLHTEMENFW